jgi:predicted metal-dependent phosphoesterase TrpH
MFADLHLHTLFSDGTYTPAGLVDAAVAAGLSEIALTDHDTVDGWEEVSAHAEQAGLAFVPGTELTAELNGRELHILGYYVDSAHPELAGELRSAQEIRCRRVREMVARLNELDIAISVDAVLEAARCRAPGRPHVARALVAAGFCTSLDEAFERYLKKDRPGWVPKSKMSVAKALRLIHAAGGVAVIAHPGLNHDDRLVGRLARMGFDGIECRHPKHSPAATARYEEMARELGLIATGGSDCHGTTKNRPTIGTVRIPRSWVDALRQRVAERRAEAAKAAKAAGPDAPQINAGAEACAASPPASPPTPEAQESGSMP